MRNIEDVHRRLEELKRRRRELNRIMKDELSQNEEYQKIVDELKVLREKKKSIENTVKAQNYAETEELEQIKDGIKVEQEMLTDLALNQYVSGQTVEIQEDDVKYIPQFSVKFKKEKSSYVAEVEAQRAKSHPERTYAPATSVA